VSDNAPACAARIALANDHGQLERLEAWLQQFARACDLPRESAFGLDLVLTEAITNIMDHARPQRGGGGIELVCALQEGCIAVQITDDGPPFDPTARAPANLPKRLDDARPGGLGIHLMRQYTNAMQYRRENDHNVLCMTLPLRPGERPD